MEQFIPDSSCEKLLQLAVFASFEAGKAIMSVYNSVYDIQLKSDNSPLTIADKKAHKIIFDVLKTTKIPILSEEGENKPYKTRMNWNSLWIVDPLDGTKEFIKHNDEFTVNIALIHKKQPIIGVVYCPPQKTIYFGGLCIKGAYKAILNEILPDSFSELMACAKRLPFTKNIKRYCAVASRSHANEETQNFITALKDLHQEIQIVSIGSSLKFCLVAEGSADIYPRFSPTNEWDTAAAQAIVELSGGEVINATTNLPLTYNKENLLNPSFIVRHKSSES